MATNERQCLILGPPNAGKTQLIKTLQKVFQHKKDNNKSTQPGILLPPTQPTAGTNLVTIDTSHGSLLLKECGGKMAPLWYKIIPKTDMLLYVVDASNPLQLSSAVVLLMESLSISSSQLAVEEFKQIMRVEDLKVNYKLETAAGNCINHESLHEVIQWLCDS
jgi:GTPase SAR1 family protein